MAECLTPVLSYAVPYLLSGIAGPIIPPHSAPRCGATGLIQLLHRDFQPNHRAGKAGGSEEPPE